MDFDARIGAVLRCMAEDGIAKLLQGEIDGLERRLGRITVAPELAAKGPADFKARPTFRLPAANAIFENSPSVSP